MELTVPKIGEHWKQSGVGTDSYIEIVGLARKAGEIAADMVIFRRFHGWPTGYSGLFYVPVVDWQGMSKPGVRSFVKVT